MAITLDGTNGITAPAFDGPLDAADIPDASQAWADYRRALLDITLQAGFPNDVVWPIKPEVQQ